jgi:hypothetical protein
MACWRSPPVVISLDGDFFKDLGNLRVSPATVGDLPFSIVPNAMPIIFLPAQVNLNLQLRSPFPIAHPFSTLL